MIHTMIARRAHMKRHEACRGFWAQPTLYYPPFAHMRHACPALPPQLIACMLPCRPDGRPSDPTPQRIYHLRPIQHEFSLVPRPSAYVRTCRPGILELDKYILVHVSIAPGGCIRLWPYVRA
jgi:hypothetical protein